MKTVRAAMWHDNETTTVDYVNFRLVAKACAELIRDTGVEPISIGISGGWGAGKSSLVRMVASELSPEQATREKVEGAENSKYVVKLSIRGFTRALKMPHGAATDGWRCST